MSDKNLTPSDPNKHNTAPLGGLLTQIRLTWRLFWDDRVPIWAKSVIPLSLAYLISPIDLIPDALLGLGQLDDLGVILLGMALFLKLCPPDVVAEHRDELEYGESFENGGDDDVIDASYRIIDKE
jgi:uncharacterized membrane protein YkvA (DUF1232 family)